MSTTLLSLISFLLLAGLNIENTLADDDGFDPGCTTVEQRIIRDFKGHLEIYRYMERARTADENIKRKKIRDDQCLKYGKNMVHGLKLKEELLTDFSKLCLENEFFSNELAQMDSSQRKCLHRLMKLSSETFFMDTAIQRICTKKTLSEKLTSRKDFEAIAKCYDIDSIAESECNPELDLTSKERVQYVDKNFVSTKACSLINRKVKLLNCRNKATVSLIENDKDGAFSKCITQIKMKNPSDTSSGISSCLSKGSFSTILEMKSFFFNKQCREVDSLTRGEIFSKDLPLVYCENKQNPFQEGNRPRLVKPTSTKMDDALEKIAKDDI